MHEYRLVRKGALVEIFIDGRLSSKTVSANQRNELRNFLASCGIPPADIDFKVHELYTTNTTSFACGQPNTPNPVSDRRLESKQ